MLVDIHAARTDLLRLIERASAGEEIIIGRAGRPVARIVPYVERVERRQPGAWRGQVLIARDFDDTPEEIIDAFER